jgi:hypothetical protein
MDATSTPTATTATSTPKKNDTPCDYGGEFSGMIFIRPTKEGMAEYIAKKLEGT